MKKIITITLITCASAQAQFYHLKTNLFQTNTVSASATLTMAGTNYFDVTRYRTISIVAIWSGSNTNTNSVTWTFRGSPDGTNWEVYPRWSLVATNYGTNQVTAATNISVIDIGYLKPFQVINDNTNSLTNVVVYGQAKESPRN